ncbi:MAG TPA: bifunctional DNA-formamidopyrimidine glycosylase/DNA-(apurinic or apyrimidinic site) lyase [Longimicrobiales bacterium]|nr:bifunctional DNA-formamidopyrimidine glycosylase/DNA-(apurinic or apyrimidinic site) lyase [Longimicrobiales bacterium]
MPELPEAETIVRGLRKTVVGERIAAVNVIHSDVLRTSPRRLAARLRGRVIRDVGRRGKNVLLLLDGGIVLAVNLGMTGRLLPFPAPPRGAGSPTHPAVRLRFEGGGVLVFDDQRRFGTFEALASSEWAQRDQRMGPEPLAGAFTPERLAGDLARSRSPVRSWLLDQRRIAGVGNIYALEALHRARIHPLRPADRVGVPGAARLHQALRDVLREAIGRRGTTIRDYRDAAGDEGAYAPRLRVYGREGEPCPACGTAVARVVLANRSAYFCPACQPAMRRTR